MKVHELGLISSEGAETWPGLGCEGAEVGPSLRCEGAVIGSGL